MRKNNYEKSYLDVHDITAIGDLFSIPFGRHFLLNLVTTKHDFSPIFGSKLPVLNKDNQVQPHQLRTNNKSIFNIIYVFYPYILISYQF